MIQDCEMKRLFNKLISSAGYSLRWYPPRLLKDGQRRLQVEFPHLAAHLMLRQPDVYFVGIGANDGVTHEPLYTFIRDHGWKGLMVEPIPLAFERLQHNLSQYSGVTLVNAAVGEVDGESEIYTVDPAWSHASHMSLHSSFDKSILMAGSRWNADLEKHIRQQSVKVMTFDSLIRHYKLPRIDVIKIDTEGYDLRILRTIDFLKYQPSIILAEHANIDREGKIEMCELFLDNHYHVALTDLDMIAYRIAHA